MALSSHTCNSISKLNKILLYVISCTKLVSCHNKFHLTRIYFFMEQENITVLLTGAGGNIGREVVEMMVRRTSKYRLRVFDLDTPKNREYFDRYKNQIDIYLGDITRPESLLAPTKGIDVVIHMASVIPPLALDNPELAQRVNVDGTRNLVEAVKTQSPEAQIIMASSVATYGDRLLTPFINVGDPLIPSEGDTYAKTKIEMENIIQRSGLKWTIYRLAAIMGAGNHNAPKLMFRMPLEQTIEICTPRDTARAFVNTLEHLEEVQERIFNLGGGSSCTTTFAEFLSTNFEIYGLAPLDFPSHAFAQKNFHCGYYEDGDELENILHFRRDSLEDYYNMVRAKTPRIQWLATKAISKLIKSYLLSKSEPYKAWLEQDEEAMKLYFRD